MCYPLHDGDADRRVEFLEMFLDLMRNDENLQDKIWWSGEVCFILNGHINRYNCTYWSQENPHVILEKEVNVLAITVWAAMSSNGFIGPFFFDALLFDSYFFDDTGKRYLNMLQIYFFPKVQQQEDIYFQQDRAPAHYAHCVRESLDINFNDKWIGRRGSFEWPARLPDLSSVEFFLWGFLKDMVYKEKPRTIPDIRRVIADKIATTDMELCQKVCRNVAERFVSCIEHNEGTV